MPEISYTLTDPEIENLTRRTWKKSQIKVLRALGIEHRVRPDGSIIVLRAHVEYLLGGKTPAKVDRSEEPNWDAVS